MALTREETKGVIQEILNQLVNIGVLDVSRIPGLDADKIISGQFDSDRIPDLPASKVTSGEFAVGRIPNLPASKVASGILASARIPDATDSSKGAVELSDSSENTDGTATDKVPTVAGVKSMIDEHAPSGTPDTSMRDIYKVTDENNQSYTNQGQRRRVNLTISGLASVPVGTIVVFQYRDDDFTPEDQEVEVGINGSNYARIKWDSPLGGSLENMTLGDITRYNWYILMRAGSYWHYIGGTQAGQKTDSAIDARIASWARSTNPTGQVPVDTLPQATTAVRGAVRLSTDDDNTAGTATNRVPTVKGVHDMIDEHGASTPATRTVHYTAFTSSGTWTKPANISVVYVVVVGGGCGGSGASSAGSSGAVFYGFGGRSGRTVARMFRAADLGGDTVTVTVGSGGDGGAASSSDLIITAGSVGGESSFGSHLSSGQRDDPKYLQLLSSSTVFSATSSPNVGQFSGDGKGESSLYGGSGGASNGVSNGAGNAGSQPGGGGGGARNSQDNSGFAGGNGGSGGVYVLAW